MINMLKPSCNGVRALSYCECCTEKSLHNGNNALELIMFKKACYSLYPPSTPLDHRQVHVEMSLLNT